MFYWKSVCAKVTRKLSKIYKYRLIVQFFENSYFGSWFFLWVRCSTCVFFTQNEKLASGCFITLGTWLSWWVYVNFPKEMKLRWTLVSWPRNNYQQFVTFWWVHEPNSQSSYFIHKVENIIKNTHGNDHLPFLSHVWKYVYVKVTESDPPKKYIFKICFYKKWLNDILFFENADLVHDFLFQNIAQRRFELFSEVSKYSEWYIRETRTFWDNFARSFFGLFKKNRFIFWKINKSAAIFWRRA